MQLTYRYRIKDKHAKRLNAQARAVNFLWNYCNETQMKAARDGRKWLSGYDLWKLVAGCFRSFLNVHRYASQEQLIADLGEKVIRPAELKVLDLQGST
jgi:hypothetical protein